MKKKNILIIFGTRPEGIKLAPLILELKKHPEHYNVLVCNTEQQKELSRQALSHFGLVPDFNLDAMRPDQSLGELQTRLMGKLQKLFNTAAPDAVIVQGDTMSVFCGALTAFYNKIPVFHVEAGLRSHNIHEPFPEEAIRRMTANITDIHFAPTGEDRDILIREGIPGDRVFVTGNTGIDALFRLPDVHIKRAAASLKTRGVPEKEHLVLMTVHRRENIGKRLLNILTAFERLACDFPAHHFILPVHPNPHFKIPITEQLSSLPNLHLTAPLDYPAAVHLMRRADLILTDSGGIQEEAPTFGTPVLVLRNKTERMATITSGRGKLVGTQTDAIIASAAHILSQPSRHRTRGINPYGDGKASFRIEGCLRKHLFEEKNQSTYVS